MQLFVMVCQHGSLSAAGRHLGFSPASVSRHINNLEDLLGVRLLNRTSRKLTLTEAGELYLHRAEQILNDIKETHESISELQQLPRGTLRVHSRLLVGTLHLVPALPQFLAQYPELKVDLTMSNFPVDLVEQNIDVDVRIGALTDSALVVRKLASSERFVVATPEYLASHPRIREPRDLEQHNCLTYRINLGRSVWRFLDAGRVLTEIPVSGSLQSDNGPALLTAALAGLGVAMVPDWAVSEQLAAGGLVRLLPEYQATITEFENGVYAVFQPSRHKSAKVRVFVDFLATLFKRRLS